VRFAHFLQPRGKGQIKLRRIDGWRKIGARRAEEAKDRLPPTRGRSSDERAEPQRKNRRLRDRDRMTGWVQETSEPFTGLELRDFLRGHADRGPDL
jgi:hypothetical protein